jgi:hypothetical protein
MPRVDLANGTTQTVIRLNVPYLMREPGRPDIEERDRVVLRLLRRHLACRSRALGTTAKRARADPARG